MTTQCSLFPVRWSYKGREGTSSAHFSDCKRYRYELRRTWDASLRPAVFCCLNPSTATELVEDPSVRRMLSFADRWGLGALILLNLFAFRSTDPKALRSMIRAGEDPIGQDNDDTIRSIFRQHRDDRLILAWGGHGGLIDRGLRVASMALVEHGNPECFGLTKDGEPRHPLFVPDITIPCSYRALRDERAGRRAA